MTDAAVPVTDDALQSLARTFLRRTGAEVGETERGWHVELPSGVESGPFDEDSFDVVFDPVEREHQETKVLAPESDFGQQLLEHVSTLELAGYLEVTQTDLGDDYRLPGWVTKNGIEVESASFAPYYDRQAICGIVRLSIETVSEYETAFLEATAVDTGSGEVLSGLTETLLETFYPLDEGLDTESTGEPPEIEKANLRTCQEAALEAVESRLYRVRRRATRAADEEFDEYRSLQEQRLDELGGEIQSVDDRLARLGDRLDDVGSNADRMELLEKRKELRSERKELEAEQEKIRTQKRRGYQDQRAEIRSRHDLEVRTEVVAATVVRYERGELELRLRDGERETEARLQYGVGVGPTEQIECQACDSPLATVDSVSLAGGQLRCGSCSPE
jgi:hypothetical protein